jgi:hypothetical protein
MRSQRETFSVPWEAETRDHEVSPLFSSQNRGAEHGTAVKKFRHGDLNKF